MSLSPNTGVYSTNGTFSVKVQVNTGGQAINAAEGTLSFNPRELSVVSVNRTGSIFNLWVAEPTFSNSAGTINFSGGLPSGYSSAVGNIMNITFRAAGAGTARVSFTNGSVLANDGRGTNVLTAMNGGTYTIQAQSEAPKAEVIEYVAPANTPAAPIVNSKTHGDQKAWYKSKEAILSWTLPSGVTAVRTLLDESLTTVPTKVYENPISTITLSDLPDGESYFHVQFKNADGWGKVTHYRLAVDSERPTSIEISQASGYDLGNPNQILSVKVEDETSEVKRYKVKLDTDEPFEYIDETGSSTIPLPALNPGYHNAFIEAFDEAGNSITGAFSFTIEAFSKPIFTDYPSEINEEVIPVIKGLTRPNAKIEVFVRRVGSEPNSYNISSNDAGEFVFIPEGTFQTGVYELSAQATDEYGALSDVSEVIKIAVQQPGYLRVGSMIVDALSVVIPLIVLVLFLIVGTWYLIAYLGRFRRRVRVESFEALEILHREFSSLQKTLRDQELVMIESRKTKKLTKAESDMIGVLDNALLAAQSKVEKEIEDVTELTRKNSN
ncbi:hypothetical protein H6784_00510 [Candidatus Nomurabacteria bacterium]|nr:hypothetical protein [Candidatus Kaiserbacteria bacterium]MCB9813875.1 hypothetical protein [Candidatus Nomurabacteria bacterium]